MNRFEGVTAVKQTLFQGDRYFGRTLTDAQIADLQSRLADPGPIASDEEVESFFARFIA